MLNKTELERCCGVWEPLSRTLPRCEYLGWRVSCEKSTLWGIILFPVYLLSRLICSKLPMAGDGPGQGINDSHDSPWIWLCTWWMASLFVFVAICSFCFVSFPTMPLFSIFPTCSGSISPCFLCSLCGIMYALLFIALDMNCFRPVFWCPKGGNFQTFEPETFPCNSPLFPTNLLWIIFCRNTRITLV